MPDDSSQFSMESASESKESIVGIAECLLELADVENLVHVCCIRKIQLKGIGRGLLDNHKVPVK